MSTRKIVIHSCEDCPYKSHKGGFGRVMYIPCCDKNHRKNLGYKSEVQTTLRSQNIVAVYDGKIPTWCPLEEN